MRHYLIFFMLISCAAFSQQKLQQPQKQQQNFVAGKLENADAAAVVNDLNEIFKQNFNKNAKKYNNNNNNNKIYNDADNEANGLMLVDNDVDDDYLDLNENLQISMNDKYNAATTTKITTITKMAANRAVKVTNEAKTKQMHKLQPKRQQQQNNENENFQIGTTKVTTKPATTTTTTTTKSTTATTTRVTLMQQTVPILQRSNFVAKPFSTLFGSSHDTLLAATAAGQRMPSDLYNEHNDMAGDVGDDVEVLRLQDYNFLYNAERHTYFQLHTNASAMEMMMMTMMMDMRMNATTVAPSLSTTSQQSNVRLLHNVVGNTLNAAFGINAGGLQQQQQQQQRAGDIKVENVQLYDAASLRRTRYNPFNPTRILVHGWLGNSHANIYAALVPVYLQLGAGNYNVFTVNWGRGAIADYITASYRVKPVGKVLAKFIDFLHREAGMRFEDLQVIGFSMGAHIAGIAGKHVQTGRLRIIRALDPALPFFRYASVAERLARTDADYVEVLHTSVGSYGFDRPLGHVDFYANWGSQQPGCFWNECSHWRAFQLFAASMQQQPFVAQGCTAAQWQDLTKNRRCTQVTRQNLSMSGDYVASDAKSLRKRRGVYYFQTNANAPFAIA